MRWSGDTSPTVPELVWGWVPPACMQDISMTQNALCFSPQKPCHRYSKLEVQNLSYRWTVQLVAAQNIYMGTIN